MNANERGWRRRTAGFGSPSICAQRRPLSTTVRKIDGLPSVPAAPSAFTLIELLVVVAIIAVLVSIMLPCLAVARAQGKQVVCASNLAQLARGLHLYATDHRGAAMPLAYTDTALIGSGPPIYWWGTNDAAGVEHTRGFIWPYLGSDLRENGVYECPEQPWGSYAPQGAARSVTSTYGYNGYYLCPPHTPGWSYSIGRRPWRNLDVLALPQRLFAFADTAIDLGGSMPHNTALLDPPMLYQGRGRWSHNDSPTTAFRHRGATQAAHADGHVASYSTQGRSANLDFPIGSVGAANDPHYVPDWRDWRN